MKIKYLFYLSLSVLILSSCSSSQKLLQKGQYDNAIKKAVKKLKKKPESEKDITALDKAYKLANERDTERIKYLQTEGRADRWDEIFKIYSNLKYRQNLVRTVLPLNLNGRVINYEFIDYDKKIVEAKSNAAEYYYVHGKKLMNENKLDSYRQAYYEFQKVKEYMGDYSDINQLLDEAKYKGTSRVIINIYNDTHLKLPQEYLNDLVSFSTSGLNSEWVEYHTKILNEDIYYNYLIKVSLKSIAVSPDIVKEKDYVIKTEVEDGWEYVLDNQGNVMKDTSGNDIKVKKYKTLQCTVIEKLQQKSAKVSGKIEFYSNDPKSLLKSVPIATETFFEHLSARAIGDIEALDTEKKKLIQRKPLPFPNDIDMILQTTENLRHAIRDAIRNNRNLVD
ncbi:MAG: hypothetical protein JXB17_12380 [Bacteroidales bacterium]|nr:hypothetical protein [Bacteroidales bacterium]